MEIDHKNMSHLNAAVQLCLSNVYSISKLPCAAPSSDDSADGRQFRSPITCVSAVAGGGVTSKKWTKVTNYYTRCYGPRYQSINQKFIRSENRTKRLVGRGAL